MVDVPSLDQPLNTASAQLTEESGQVLVEAVSAVLDNLVAG
jgi:hypothetical protein